MTKMSSPCPGVRWQDRAGGGCRCAPAGPALPRSACPVLRRVITARNRRPGDCAKVCGQVIPLDREYPNGVDPVLSTNNVPRGGSVATPADVAQCGVKCVDDHRPVDPQSGGTAHIAG